MEPRDVLRGDDRLPRQTGEGRAQLLGGGPRAGGLLLVAVADEGEAKRKEREDRDGERQPPQVTLEPSPTRDGVLLRRGQRIVHDGRTSLAGRSRERRQDPDLSDRGGL